MPPPSRTLGELLERVSGLRWTGGAAEKARAVEIRGITANSDRVAPGHLFVAIAGSRTDGHSFVDAAVTRGAAAVIVEQDLDRNLAVPVVKVANTRHLLAEIAAAWHGDPASTLRLVGITGTLGKTSTLMMLDAILERGGLGVGTIGSLGIRVGGVAVGTGHTVPGPLELHAGLARIAAAGSEIAAMEVTSHALDQERIHGLQYDLGIFTNLVPMEHADYHPSFREYVAAKSRFFEHVRLRAPLVYSSDDAVLHAVLEGVVGERSMILIGCGEQPQSAVRIEPVEMGPEGTRLTLTVREALPGLDGGRIEPQRLEIALPLLGRSNVTNAALAVTAALCLGVTLPAVVAALASFAAPRRRMEVVYQDGFTVLDDTIGHPDSISGLFDVVQKLSFRDLHIAIVVRGSRGEQINRLLAQTLAIWLKASPAETLVVTRATDTADKRNRVADSELEAFLAPLEQAGIRFEQRDTLYDATQIVIARARPRDLVLLLGAQGMDEGAALFRKISGLSNAGSPEPQARTVA